LQAVEAQVFGGVGADQVEAQAVFDDLAALVHIDQAGFAVDLLAGRAGAFGGVELGRDLGRVLPLPAVRLAALVDEVVGFVRQREVFGALFEQGGVGFLGVSFIPFAEGGVPVVFLL
jgi:hypothetical protein